MSASLLRTLSFFLLRVSILSFSGVMLCVTHTAHAQLWNSRFDEGMETDRRFSLRSGLGFTRIVVNASGEAVNYVTLTARPELTIGRISGGLTLNLLVNAENDPGGSRVRQSELKIGHLIRYVRYGRPEDPTFIHVGALERVTIGHGFLLSRYSNQVADQSRRIGLWTRIDRTSGGIEGIFSNIGEVEVYGARIFYRPLVNRTQIPVLSRMTLGVSFLIDDNPGRNRTRVPVKSVSVYGLDIELPIVTNSVANLISYGDFGAIFDSGKGGAVGARLRLFPESSRLQMTARLEQHFLSARFTPAFFDETYEVNSVVASGDSRIRQLAGQPSSQGTLGELEMSMFGKLFAGASYRAYSNRTNSGVFHAEAHLKNIIPRITALAIYDKQQIGRLSDIRTLDNRSVVLAEVLYQALPFLFIGMDYRWTFVFDSSPDVQTYRPIERFSPRVILAHTF